MPAARTTRSVAVLLVFIVVFAALLIRVWGIGWDRLYSRHHDEQIHLHSAITFSQGELSPKTIWLPSRYPKYVLYPWLSMYLVAAVIKLWEVVSGGGNLLLAFPGMIIGDGSASGNPLDLKQKALLIGRLTVAVFGTGTVWILYEIGRDLWNRRIGLLAAAFLAFTGYHVANCHWLKNDVITLFFMVLAFWFIVRIYRTGRWKYYLLAALASALAINCKFHVFPIIFVLLAAPGLRKGRGWKGFGDWRLLICLPVFLAGLAVSFPVLYLNFDFFRDHILSYLTTMPGSYLLESGRQLSFFTIRFNNLVNMFRFSAMMEHGMGIYLTVLGAAGLIWALVRKESRLKLTAVFPVIYLLVAILVVSPGLRLQDTIPLYPFAALLTSVIISDLLSRLIGKKWLNNAVFVLVGLGLLYPYIISMLRMDYGYWQPDTSYWATWWANRNIPEGIRVAREKKTLDLLGDRHVVASKRRLCNRPVTAYRDENFSYLVTSDRQENRMTDKYGLYGPDHPFGRFYLEIEDNYNLLKIFDLGIIPYKGGVIKVYELKRSLPLTPSGLDSGLLRAFGHDYSFESPRILFLNRQGRCQGNTGFLVPPESAKEQLLVSPVPLQEIGVQVVNGPRPGTIRITAGGKKITQDFTSGQIRQFIFPARTAFPFIRFSYRVKVSSAWNSPCQVRILTDPYRIGLGYLEAGEDEKAIGYLQAAAARGKDWIAYQKLADAYQGAGRPEEARLAIETARDLFPDFDDLAADLRSAGGDRENWKTSFERLSGYDPDWLENRLALSWGEENLLKMAPSREGRGIYHTPDFILSPGEYKFVCSAGLETLPPETTLARVTVRMDYQVVFSRSLSEKDFLSGLFEIPLAVSPPGSVGSVELEILKPLRTAGFKIEFIPQLKPWLEKLFDQNQF